MSRRGRRNYNQQRFRATIESTDEQMKVAFKEYERNQADIKAQAESAEQFAIKYASIQGKRDQIYRGFIKWGNKVFHKLESAGMKEKEVDYVTRRDDMIVHIKLKDGTTRSVIHEGPIPGYVPTRHGEGGGGDSDDEGSPT